MTESDLDQLVTKKDLFGMARYILREVKALLSQASRKEFYPPKEFAEITGMKYSTVVKHCKEGKIKARQPHKNGTWLIPREEIDRIREEAEGNFKGGSRKTAF